MKTSKNKFFDSHQKSKISEKIILLVFLFIFLAGLASFVSAYTICDPGKNNQDCSSSTPLCDASLADSTQGIKGICVECINDNNCIKQENTQSIQGLCLSWKFCKPHKTQKLDDATLNVGKYGTTSISDVSITWSWDNSFLGDKCTLNWVTTTLHFQIIQGARLNDPDYMIPLADELKSKYGYDIDSESGHISLDGWTAYNILNQNDVDCTCENIPVQDQGKRCYYNEPPQIQGKSLGIIYNHQENKFSVEKTTDNSGEIINQIIPAFPLKTGIIISDKESKLEELTCSLGKTEQLSSGSSCNAFSFNADYNIENKDLPITLTGQDNVWLGVTDSGILNGQVKQTTKQGINALLCPSGNLDLIKQGKVDVFIDGRGIGTFENGKLLITFDKAKLNLVEGDCFPDTKITVEFKDMAPPIMSTMDEQLGAIQPFLEITVGDFSLTKEFRKLIKDYKMTDLLPPGRRISFKIVITTFKKDSGILTTIDISGLVDNTWPASNVPIARKYEIYNSPEGAMKLISDFLKQIKAFKDSTAAGNYGGNRISGTPIQIPSDWESIKDKPEIDIFPLSQVESSGMQKIPRYDAYWYSTEQEVSSSTIQNPVSGVNIPTQITYKQLIERKNGNEKWSSIYPLEKDSLESTFEDYPSILTTTKFFGKTARILNAVVGKSYLHFEILADSNIRNDDSSHMTLDIKPFELSGDFFSKIYVKGLNLADITTSWNLQTLYDTDKMYSFENLLTCCPKLYQIHQKFKQTGQISSPGNSIYFIGERDKIFNYEGIAYQFSPPYQFNTDVIKQFDIHNFADPFYDMKEDSFLDSCDYEVLDQVSSVISQEGGEIVLPNEAGNLDKVGEVKEIFPANAVSDPTQFTIKRIKINNCTCFNNIQDSGEQGIDCGGKCEPCVPNCYDGIQNQDETGIDVGGICVIGFISDKEEPCEWDQNKNGIIKPCIECESSQDCVDYVCPDNQQSCNYGKCSCEGVDYNPVPVKLSLSDVLQLVKGFSSGELSKEHMDFIIQQWQEP